MTIMTMIQHAVTEAGMDMKKPCAVALNSFCFHALAAELSCHLLDADERVKSFSKLLESGELTLHLTGATLMVYRHEQDLREPILLYDKG